MVLLSILLPIILAAPKFVRLKMMGAICTWWCSAVAELLSNSGCSPCARSPEGGYRDRRWNKRTWHGAPSAGRQVIFLPSATDCGKSLLWTGPVKKKKKKKGKWSLDFLNYWREWKCSSKWVFLLAVSLCCIMRSFLLWCIIVTGNA